MMIDIDKELRSASEEININFIDSDDVLAKAKIKKNNNTFIRLDIFKKVSIAFAALALIFVPITVIAMSSVFAGNSSFDAGSRGEPENTSSDDKTASDPSIDDYLHRIEKGKLPNVYNGNNVDFDSFASAVNTKLNVLYDYFDHPTNLRTNVAYSPISLAYELYVLDLLKDGDSDRLSTLTGYSNDELKTFVPMLIDALNGNYPSHISVSSEINDVSLWLPASGDYDIILFKNLSSLANVSTYLSYDLKKDLYSYLMGSYKVILPEEANNYLHLVDNFSVTDCWDMSSENMLATQDYFKSESGNSLQVDYLESLNTPGKIMKKEKYKAMYAVSKNGYCVNFLLPNEGYDVEDILKSDVLQDFQESEFTLSEDGVELFTNVKFPCFSASFSYDAAKPLHDAFGFDVNPSVDNLGVSNNSICSVLSSTLVDFETIHNFSNNRNESENNKNINNLNQTFTINRPFVYTIVNPVGITVSCGAIYNVD